MYAFVVGQEKEGYVELCKTTRERDERALCGEVISVVQPQQVCSDWIIPIVQARTIDKKDAFDHYTDAANKSRLTTIATGC